MTFQLQIDKNSFQFHIIYIGMNPLKKDAATRTKEEIETIRHVYLDLDQGGARKHLKRSRIRMPYPNRITF
jgi:hypothetical protein